MPEFGISPEELQRLAQLVEQNNLSELRYEDGDLRITLRTASYQRGFAKLAPALGAATTIDTGPAFEAAASTPEVSRPMPRREETGSRSRVSTLQVEAPIMGVFYRSAAPGESAFVDIGDMVEIGQVIGVIEAMKVFSEVPSDHAGRVSAIPAKNGGLVQPGDPLVVLEAH